ncbi:MAG: hypothetical protein K8R99_02010 [Actinomycetia bacterium]|nr:hypothetical protein [Actinomycetes bacterium]
MDTSAGFQDEGPADAGDARVDAFFAKLCREQARYLQTFGHARSLLGSESGQLAHVTAIQGRLTRQFFDAQRGIMLRRADVDAEVAAIVAAAAEHSLALVESARAQVAAGLIPPAGDQRISAPISGVVPVIPADGELCDQQKIASLGVSALHTMEEADVLASVINDAFESREPDGAVAERQLAALLDEWWAVEVQEGGAVIDDANARAAVRRHVGTIEAGEIFENARVARAGQVPEPKPTGVPPTGLAVTARPIAQLPHSVVDLTNNADTSDLATLFAELAASLEEPTAARPTLPVLAVAPAIDVDRSTELQLPVADPDDPFRRFWEQGPFPNASSNRWTA